MRIVHALQPLTKSIFLAGPTPRSSETPSWRPKALEILEAMNFDGMVFVPEDESWASHDQYEAQIHWEWEALNQATIVAFWVPRELTTMPAFTTNVEFGLLASSNKVFLGAPKQAPKMAYLKALAHQYRIPYHDTLENLLCSAVDEIEYRIARASRKNS